MLFTIAYLVCGVGIFAYSGFQLGQMVVNARLRSMWERRRMERAIDKLMHHYIVCGNGRMGRTICGYLAARKRPFVVIDNQEEKLLPLCAERGWLNILGDATNDDVLRQAGIERAQSIACVLPTDADNVYVVLAARMLNANLQIVVRASEERAVEKMQRAGADRVISPIHSSAEKMARFMLTPSIEDFLEIADAEGHGLELADVQIRENSPYVGKTLADTNLRSRGVMVIGIRRANGERLMPPDGSVVIQPGDCLFAFGNADAVNAVIGETPPDAQR
jgi:voltage-gated potassium channel